MAFAAFHRFCYVIFSFSLVRYLWISSLILHWPNSCSLACCLGLPWCSIGKESACTIPGSGRSSGRGHGNTLQYSWASLVAQIVKNLPAMQEFWVQSLGREDPLGKEMATHSSILTWRIPWTEEPDGLQSIGLQRVRHDLETKPAPLPLSLFVPVCYTLHYFLFI